MSSFSPSMVMIAGRRISASRTARLREIKPSTRDQCPKRWHDQIRVGDDDLTSGDGNRCGGAFVQTQKGMPIPPTLLTPADKVIE